jgi:hypothetical protein
MREYKAVDWHRVTGRGDVANVLNDEEYENGKSHLIGEKVLIDGQVYTVAGVEAFALRIIPKGSPIGLLVREPRSISDAEITSSTNSPSSSRTP